MRWSNPNFVDLAADAGTGVIMLRPVMLKYAEDPVILHELLHAYHDKLMPQGFDNVGIKAIHADAMSKKVFRKEEYAMKNRKEFFAVTASVFLAGKGTIIRAENPRGTEGKDAEILQVSRRAVRLRPGTVETRSRRATPVSESSAAMASPAAPDIISDQRRIGAALPAPVYSTLIPANLTTFSHFSVSAAIIAPKSSGVAISGSPPSSIRRF